MQWSSLAMLLLMFAGMAVMFGFLRHQQESGLLGCVTPLFLTLALVALLFVLVLVQISAPSHREGFVLPPGTEPWALAFGSVCVGICLYYLRGWHKGLYGMIEVVVAAVILTVSAVGMNVNTATTNTIALLSAIYVLVRGLTNIGEYVAAHSSTPD
jgi:hypothetical protein